MYAALSQSWYVIVMPYPPQPRPLEVPPVWASVAMAMRTYTNVVPYVLSLVHKNEMRIACFLGAPI